MKLVRFLGILLTGGGGLAAWLSLAGGLFPQLDVLASFLPLFGTMILFGLLLAWRRPVATITAALVALLPVAIGLGPEMTRKIPAAPQGSTEIRLLTHNVWLFNENPGATAQAILDAHPDVVMLQEVNGSFHPMLAILGRHFPYATKCPRGCDRVILSRWPIVEKGYYLRDSQHRKFGPPLLWVRIATPDGRSFTAMTLHYLRPTSRDQATQRRDVAQVLARIDRGSLIVAGDMNLTPWAAAMREQDRAFAPLVRMTRAIPSWPRPFPVLPIDQLYAGPDWGLVSAERLPPTGSDHIPILVTLARR